MNIDDRSVIERLSHPCLRDNTVVEVRIYKKVPEEEGGWIYVPPGLALGEGERHKAEIMIRNIGREIDFDDVGIRVTKHDNEALQGAITLFEDASFEVEADAVELVLGLLRAADSPAGMLGARKSAPVFLVSNRRIDEDDRQSLFTFQVRAMVVPRAHYEQSTSPQHDFERPIISVRDLNFGKVTTGETSEPRQLIAENIGEANLFVSRIVSPTNDAFSLELTEAPETELPEDPETELHVFHLAELKPGESAVLGNVTFAPAEEEEYLDTIKIHSNDPTCRSKEVQLSGKGAYWFRVFPDCLDFGDVDMRESEPGVNRYFTLENAHPSRVCTVKIMYTPSIGAGIAFTFSACTFRDPCTIRPGRTCEVSVTAEPNYGGREGEHVLEQPINVEGADRSFYVTLRANAVLLGPP